MSDVARAHLVCPLPSLSPHQTFRVLFFTHRIPGSWHFIVCLSQSEALGIVFYTQDSGELAFHIVFVTIRSLVYCLITHRISRSLHFILCLSQSEASCIVFYTQHCREWACHSVFVTIRSLVYCFLHRIAGSLHVIVCLSQPEASCVVFYTGLTGVGLP